MFKKLIAITVILSMCLCTTLFAATPVPEIPVLLYHHILSEDENNLYKDNGAVVSLEDFEEQMKYLYDNNFYTITPDELYNFLYKKTPLPEKSVFIQFDDGYYSNIVRAYPVLKKYGFKATIFTITETARAEQKQFHPDTFSFISRYSMEDTKDVFTYASHTNDMHVLKDRCAVFMLASRDELLDDLSKCFEIVDNKNAFAYPRGQFNQDIIDTLKEGGIKMAFTTNSGYITQNSDPYRLNRFIVFRNTPISSFEYYVNGYTKSPVNKTSSVATYSDGYTLYNDGVKSDMPVLIYNGKAYLPINNNKSFRVIIDEGTKNVFMFNL